MAPSSSLGQRAHSGLERVRHQFLTALHLGKLVPGDRVPSVRRLAEMTGLNPKTVHGAYRQLAQEGLLELRPGSGSFIAAWGEGVSPIGKLLRAANRARAAAGSLGLDPQVFASFLQVFLGSGLTGLPMLVVECNLEQLGLIEQELRASAGIDARSVLLADLDSPPPAWVRQSGGVVTTDCHLKEVAAIFTPLAVPVYRIALDPEFPRQLLEQARRTPVILLVGDAAFGPAFSRLLEQLAVPAEFARRFRIVEGRHAAAVLRETREPAAVHVSPLVTLTDPLPARFRRLRLRWRIEPASLEALKASLALDLARRFARDPVRAPASSTRRPLARGTLRLMP